MRNGLTKYDTRFSVADQPPVQYAICAVSGGMDSSVCLHHAIHLYGAENVVGISIYYGQRHDIELRRAEDICIQLGITYRCMDMSFIYDINKNVSALLKGSSKEISQDKDYATLMKEKIAKGEAPISDEYIPNRNSLFINMLCTIGLQLFDEKPFTVIAGMHADDALKQEGSDVYAYPDCSPEFADATNKALQLSTAGLCYLYTPIIHKSKAEVAEFGLANGMTIHDFNKTWSCYKGDAKQCGRCPTCIDKIRALVKAGVYTDVNDIVDSYDISLEEAKFYLTKA